MNSSYIPKKMKHSPELVSRIKKQRDHSALSKERLSAIYAAILFLTLLGSLTLFFLGETIMLNKIAVCTFIISCILLIRVSGPTH
ncbi:hypothetical protein [Winogradskyella sp.]|uniref:hypothetical protein n=1 Tax=Winogradskyella sp. TaxID=1883156 RepID=UPI0025D33E16|nr:hypothetical protein [Winogradskyella sp.]